MSTRIVSVLLTRDGFKQPWGFRLQGGREVNAPLSIQRVFIGSPSEGQVHRGDVITRINEQDARYMDHAEALELLKSLGIQLKLEILRSSTGGAPTTSQSMWAPSSSNARSSSPYRPVSPRPASPYRPVASPVPTVQRQSSSLAAPGRVTVINDSGYKSPVLNYTIPVPASDRQTISQQVTQPPAADDGVFRSKPLITPSPKATHYKTSGSYLRRDQAAPIRSSAQSWQLRNKQPVGNDASWVRQHRVDVTQSTTPWAIDQQSTKITKEVQWPPPKPTSYRAISPVPPSSPHQWGQQAPQEPSYTPQKQSFAPQQQSYVPQQPSYAPQQPSYAPQQPSYAPQQQSYAPQQQSYAPQQQSFIPVQNAPSPQPSWSAPQQRSSPAPSSQAWQPQSPSSFKPVNPSFNRTGAPATSPKPKWPPQNPSSGGPVTISVPAPDVNKHVVHSQYNSPLNLYSAQNVAATITGQTGVEPKVSGNQKPDFDVTKSPTYQLLMEEEARKKQHKSPPQDPEDGITQSKSFKMLQMWTGESEF